MNPTAQLNPEKPAPNKNGTLPDLGARFAVADHPHRPTESPGADAFQQRAELRSFRKISSDFFSVEAGREHRKELFLFAWIGCVVAWPLGTILYHLTRWMISPPHRLW